MSWREKCSRANIFLSRWQHLAESHKGDYKQSKKGNNAKYWFFVFQRTDISFFREKVYTNVTFTMDEIFHSNQTKALNNATEYDVKEILTMILGRCFVIQKKREVTMFE